jgi:hypothetical protein
MIPPLQPRESVLLAGVLGLVALALLGPAVAQHAGYHAFADQQLRWGVPHAVDVLSNLPFALVALAGAWRLQSVGAQLPAGERTMAWLSCAGLLLTALGSSWYHLQPHDAGLLVDRTAMSVVFAGLLGLAACRVSQRSGMTVGLLVLVAAPAAAQSFAATGNLLPWVVVQGGGLVLLAVLATSRPAPSALPIRWWLVIAGYAVAKLLELQDHAIWRLTGEVASGHSLKHVVAALSVLPVIAAWRRPTRPQNPGQRPLQAARQQGGANP